MQSRAWATDERRHRWEAAATWPLLGAATLFLGAYAWPILDPHLEHHLRHLCRVTNAVVWVMFAVDLAVRVSLAEHRRRFLRANWLDVATLALPMLRPLRALRAVVALNVLARRGGAFARGRVVGSVVGAVVMVGFVASLAMLDAERGNPRANITGFGDAVWWAAATVTTVGYGDRYPTTVEGRMIAIALMATGIGLLGVVTAALASWFVERMSEVQEVEQRTSDELSALALEVRKLREELRESRTPAQP